MKLCLFSKQPLSVVLLYAPLWTSILTSTVLAEVDTDVKEKNEEGLGVCHWNDTTCREAHVTVDCGVYMAPSTIGVANMGIYTSKPLPEGAVVNYPDIAIPLLFRDWGYHGENPDGTLWDRYIWDHGVANTEPKISDLQREDTGAVFVPGVGCTINSRLELNNIHSTHNSIYDTAGLHRSQDPGSGAFCPYHSSQTTIATPVKAGAELFAKYGDSWIPEIPGAIITFDENMDKADDFLDEYAAWVDENQLPPDLAEGLWTLTKEFPITSPILGAMPQVSWSDVKTELEIKTEQSTVRHFVREIGHHTVEWLQENGKCQDHIKPGRSTISQAGRGAFAARNLPKGTVVGFSPLVHIGNAREILAIEYQTGRENYTIEDLIINYSFGHPNSTVLLTPYGAMVNYINHHRELANVKVQWPQKELIPHKPDWLLENPEFLANVHEKIGLSFDYVALRDIQEGEEIFMDYGDDWIQAWERHVENWTPVPGADVYRHSTEWNEPTLKTLSEISEAPYPPNLITLCRLSYRVEGKRNVFMSPQRDPLTRYYCDVLDRSSQAPYRYRVKIYVGNEGQSVIVEDVTSPEGIELTDKIKTADWHLPNAFRHPISIPDDIMPDAWKNK
jgi:hypothetical protein